ncbi:MAG: hypothetical protein AMJ90_06900 [candidate division Zixibacteria bacterium SM23_73_2]|nr:MAG: hypothetical protein AMJ90_06900 [candidate division Zixibacteria bacterium SM23_73_2]
MKNKENKVVNGKQWNQFRNVRDDALDFPPYKTWFDEIQKPDGLMKLSLYCPLCGEVISVTFRKPFSKPGFIDTKTFHAKARFHHCNGISVRLELHPFDSRYHDEYLKEGVKK